MVARFSKKHNADFKRTMPYRIVNFATIATPLRLEERGDLLRSKAALVNLTQVVAKELRRSLVLRLMLWVLTCANRFNQKCAKGKMDSLLNQQAIKRFGSFEDVLNVIEFFL